MPEGPEVTWLTNYIQDHVQGKVLTKARILHGRYKNHGPPANFIDFSRTLPRPCDQVTKKGKVIFMHFGPWCLISKLGMTGTWYMPGDEPTWHRPVACIVLEFGQERLIFSDIRNYGTLTVTEDKSVIEHEINKLAPDIVSEGTTYREIESRIMTKVFGSRPNTALMEDILVDQKALFSGVGNYLKSEILYESRISPLRMAKDVSMEEWKTIFRVCKRTIKRMMRAIDTQDLDAYEHAMKVYMKKKDPLGNAIHVHTTKAGRSTFWVPSLQK